MAHGRGVSLEVALLWGDRLLELRHFNPGQVASLRHLPQDVSPVRARSEDQAWTVQAEGAPRRRSGDAPREVVLDRAPVVMPLGAMRLVLRQVAKVAPVRGRLEERDFSFFKVVSCGLLSFAAALVAITLSPEPEPGLSDELSRKPLKTSATRWMPPPPPKPLQVAANSTAPSTSATKPEPSGGGAAKGAEGKARKAHQVGILDALRSIGPSGASVFGRGGLGDHINTAMNRLSGPGGFASTDGIAGLGTRGTGPGVGGPGLGIGGVGTTRGSGGPGAFNGLGGGLRSHIAAPPPEHTRVVGGLDRDVILKVIKSHQSEIKYCYEKELSRDPALAGKVAVLFEIDPAGAVTGAQIAESTLDNPSTQACILRRINGWTFPAPKGGGTVSVNFPWIFRPAGAE